MEARPGGRLVVRVSAPEVPTRLRRRLRNMGAADDIVAEPAAIGGYQQARLDRLAELRGRHRRHFLPAQYSNPDNPAGYGVLAELPAAAPGRGDIPLRPVGSGRSMCGTVARPRPLL